MVSEDFPRGGNGFFAEIRPGSRVAGYLLEEQVGRGGMAVVFRAVDELLERRVALKFLAPALAADQAFRQRFIRKSRAAAFVDDPHIIPVHAAREAGGVLFIAMRWVPGGDVRALMDEVGPLPAEQATEIISQVASALDSAHAAGLVHRDVKPANMLVDRRPDRPDHVYLSDFGLTKGTLTLSSPALTKFGEYLGTPLYTAPEQIQSRTMDGRADQYALACAAFEMLAGEPAFQRDHQGPHATRRAPPRVAAQLLSAAPGRAPHAPRPPGARSGSNPAPPARGRSRAGLPGPAPGKPARTATAIRAAGRFARGRPLILAVERHRLEAGTQPSARPAATSSSRLRR
jgi:serine/threonine protein kinase